MRILTRFETLHGRDEPPQELRELRAGPVTAQLDGADLRYVRVGGVEVVRRIYVAVRDQNWNTIPAEYTDFDLDLDEDRFSVSFVARHVRDELDFAWGGTIEGSPDGTIRLSMDDGARSDFRFNRIGFCVLHPYQGSAGRPFRGQGPDGPVQGTLPRLIGPQRFRDGYYLALFPAVETLAIELESGGEVRFGFEGDLFEMEDQRNWTDASFKTYCTPLTLGFPHVAKSGQKIAQRVTVSIDDVPTEAPPAPEEVSLSLGPPAGRTLPPIGLGMASHGEPLSAREVELLRTLRPHHLRADLHLVDPTYGDALDLALEACAALDCGLEAAVFLTEDMAGELDRLAALLEGRGPVERLVVFEEGAVSTDPGETTPPALVELARQRLRAAIPAATFAGGTDMYFCELNRTRPQVGTMDEVVYSVLPQQHAFDELSMVETLEAQAETVKTARSFCADRPLVVSPITLKPRFNPVATTTEEEEALGELPSQVDSRQMSLFGAAWTLGSVKYLSEGGVGSLTYYETTGWLGVMERETGSPLPEHFPSQRGMAFPLLHVFADLAERKGADLLECRSSEPLAAIGLALGGEGVLSLLLANFTPRTQAVTAGPVDADSVSIHHLDEETAQLAMLEPERFRAGTSTLPVEDGWLAVELAPYAVARVDAPAHPEKGSP